MIGSLRKRPRSLRKRPRNDFIAPFTCLISRVEVFTGSGARLQKRFFSLGNVLIAPVGSTICVTSMNMVDLWAKRNDLYAIKKQDFHLCGNPAKGREYSEPGSNRHALRHWCLRPTRLPIPPSEHWYVALIVSCRVKNVLFCANDVFCCSNNVSYCTNSVSFRSNCASYDAFCC